MTAAAHVVTVGALPGAALADPEGAVVAAALMEAGVPVASRVVLDEDEAALERALTPDDGLTVVIAGGGSAGDVARRVVARAVGARLVLNERFLAALEERYRRLDRPLPRRAERLALVPQGAPVGEPELSRDVPGAHPPDLLANPEPCQHPQAVRRQRHARADLGQLLRLLMHLDVDPGPRQRDRRRDPADPAADNHRPQSHVLRSR